NKTRGVRTQILAADEHKQIGITSIRHTKRPDHSHHCQRVRSLQANSGSVTRSAAGPKRIHKRRGKTDGNPKDPGSVRRENLGVCGANARADSGASPGAQEAACEEDTLLTRVPGASKACRRLPGPSWQESREAHEQNGTGHGTRQTTNTGTREGVPGPRGCPRGGERVSAAQSNTEQAESEAGARRQERIENLTW
ncbi:hypothetical protein C8R43DRAFT_1106411, partial [Mycena crocata]